MHTVFGRVVDGHKYVTEIENQRVDTNHRPYADIRIVRCGELVLIKPNKGIECYISTTNLFIFYLKYSSLLHSETFFLLFWTPWDHSVISQVS